MSDQQIKELNTYCLTRVAPSKVHGVGVFALKDLPKGSVLFADMMIKMYTVPYESFSEIYPEARQLILERWPQVVNGSRFCFPDTRIQAYMNHSESPNYDAITDTVLEDIPAGTEITEDYRKIKGYEKVFPFLVANTKQNV